MLLCSYLFMPRLCGFVCFLSYSKDILHLFEDNGYSGQQWQYFGVVMPKILYLSCHLPVFMCAMINRCSESRFFGLIGGIAAWMALLQWTANLNETIAYPFMSRTQDGNKAFHTHQIIIDIVMCSSLLLSLMAGFMSSQQNSKFDGFSSRLDIPLVHRLTFAKITRTYMLFVGTCEVVSAFTEKNFDENNQRVSWVWPPDGADCNKVHNNFVSYLTFVNFAGSIYLLLLHQDCCWSVSFYPYSTRTSPAEKPFT